MAKNWSEAQVKEKEFWKKIYVDKENDIAESYTPISTDKSIDFSKKTCLRHSIDIHDISDKVLADIGCGPFGIILGLDNLFKSGSTPKPKILGVDPLMNFYKSEIGLLKDTDNIQLFEAKAENLPIENSYCDFVFCVNVLDHVENPDECVRELHRITKPGGLCCISLHVVTSLVSPISPFLKYVDTNHPHHLTYSKVNQLLSQSFDRVQLSYSASMLEDHPEFAFKYIFNSEDKTRAIKRSLSTLILQTLYFNCNKD